MNFSRAAASNNKHGGPRPATSVRMSLSGTTIRDHLGNAFVPIGFNWGSNTYYSTADAAEDVSLGANCVRIIPRGWGDYSAKSPDGESVADTGHWDPDYITDIIDPQVFGAKAAGLKVILARDSNCGINCHQDVAACTISGSPNQSYFNNATKKTHFLEMWDFLAERYYGFIDFYEPAVEPIADTTSVSTSELNDFQEEAMDRILVKDPGALFIIGGKAYQNNQVGGIYRGSWATDYPNKIILTCNFLGGALSSDFSGKLANLTSARTAAGVPALTQQLGINTSDDTDDAFTTAGFDGCRAAGIGVIYWEKVTTGIDSFGLWYLSGSTRVLKPLRHATVSAAMAAF